MIMCKAMAGVWRHTQPRTKERMYIDKREDTVVVVAHHSTAERGGPPDLTVVAQPHLPRVRARQSRVVMDVERLEGEVISLCGAGGMCEAMKTGLLLAG